TLTKITSTKGTIRIKKNLFKTKLKKLFKMSKVLSVLLFLAGLIAFVHAEDVIVNVGGPAGENIFDPTFVLAFPGDTVCIEIFIYFFVLSFMFKSFAYQKIVSIITRLFSIGCPVDTVSL